ncbi:MAG TPA: hypothetical protein ENN05_07215 [Deltaproteobacteria bacterium]|nr:hypothetical protein [Deltaproteobacteria bacterium]
MKIIPARTIFIGFMCMLAAGCSSLSSYERFTIQARQSISQGRFDDALSFFPDKSAKGRNEVLIRLERGILLQALGEYDMSAREFRHVAEMIRDYENMAVISATKSTSQVASLLVNEQVMPYVGEDFEKVLVHGFNAVNYLMMGDLEGARVEIRNAYTRQKELYEKHSRELEKAKKESAGIDWNSSFIQADPDGYALLKRRADSVQSLYQNAFAYYISALVYELNGEYDEAYIDLKKAIDAAPDSESIQKDLIRLSGELYFLEDMQKWEQRYGKRQKIATDAVDVFVIFSYGLAPYKEAVGFPIPVPRGGVVFASMPVYRFTPSSVHRCALRYEGNYCETSSVSNIEAIAARNLLDKFPVLFAKQVARTYLKARLTGELSDQFGAVGALTGTLASAITEQADLRTWSSLPKDVRIARAFVPRNTSSITLEYTTGSMKSSVDIPEGSRHLIVLCRATENGLSIQTKSY